MAIPSISKDTVDQLIHQHYTSSKAVLKGIPLSGKVQIIAENIFYDLNRDADGAIINENAVMPDEFRLRVRDKIYEEIKEEVSSLAKKNPQDLHTLPSHDKIGYIVSLLLKTNPDIDIKNQREAFFVYEIAHEIVQDLSVDSFVHRIQKADEKRLHQDFPFLKDLKMNIQEKKAHLIKKYREYQKDFAQYDLSLLPGMVKDFQRVTDWDSCAQIFELNSRPLSPRARTFIAFGYLVGTVNRFTNGLEKDPAIQHFIYNEHSSIRGLSSEQLALWGSFASISLEMVYQDSLQQMDTSYPIRQEIDAMLSQPQKTVKLDGIKTPIKMTSQFGKDYERIGKTNLTIKFLDGQIFESSNKSSAEIVSNLEAAMHEDQAGFFVLQEMTMQTPQNAGTEWLLKDLSAKTGLTTHAVSEFLGVIPQLTERKIEQLDQDTVQVTYTFDMILQNQQRKELSIELANPDLIPQMPASYLFVYSCEIKRDPVDGKWIPQEPKQHSTMPALGKSKEPSLPLISESLENKGKEEEERSVTHMLQESEKRPLAGNGKHSKSTKLTITDLMTMYQKEPSNASTSRSSQSSSSQATKAPQPSNPIAQQTPSQIKTFDMKKIREIDDKIHDGKQVSSKEITYFTDFVCTRLKSIMRKETFSTQDRAEFNYGRLWIQNRYKTLTKFLLLNSSEKKELAIIENYKINPKAIFNEIDDLSDIIPNPIDPRTSNSNSKKPILKSNDSSQGPLSSHTPSDQEIEASLELAEKNKKINETMEIPDEEKEIGIEREKAIRFNGHIERKTLDINEKPTIATEDLVVTSKAPPKMKPSFQDAYSGGSGFF